MPSYAREMAALIGCDCSEIVGQRDGRLLRSMLKRARRLGAENGFTPVIIECSEENLEWLRELSRLGRCTAEYRERLTGSAVDGGLLLSELIEERRAEGTMPEPIGVLGGAAQPELCECFQPDGTPKDVLIAYIPAKAPWEAVAWLPCCSDVVSDGELISVMRYFYRQYGAAPTVIGCNYIELSAQPLSLDVAVRAAAEQYALAPDIVDKGIGSISALAGTLTKSTAWLLWW